MVPEGTRPSPRRKLWGWLSLAAAAAWMATTGVIVVQYLERDPVEIEATLSRVETDRTRRPSGVAFSAWPYVSFTLESPRFLDGPYRPAFRYSPPLWSPGTAEALASRLRPGARLTITVDRSQLEAAAAALAARDRLERDGGVYNPGPFERSTTVDVIAFAAGDGEVGGTESLLGFALAPFLCAFAALSFGAAGLSLSRSQSRA